MLDRTTAATERWSNTINRIERWTRDRTEAIEARRLMALIQLDGVSSILAEYEDRLTTARRKWDRAREDASRAREERIAKALTRHGIAIRKTEAQRKNRDDTAYDKRLDREERAREVLNRATQVARQQGVNSREQKARRTAEKKYDRTRVDARKLYTAATKKNLRDYQQQLAAVQREQSDSIAASYLTEEQTLDKVDNDYRRAMEDADVRKEDSLLTIEDTESIQEVFDTRLEEIGEERQRRLETAYIELRDQIGTDLFKGNSDA